MSRVEDGLASYTIGIAAKREMLVRSGQEPPRNAIERRWQEEGPCPVHDLQTVRDWVAEDAR